MDIAVIISTIILIPLGLGLGWAMTGKELPEEGLPEKKAVDHPAEQKQRIHKILAKSEIHPTAKMTKPKLKTALNKLTKADILFLAEHHYGFTVNKNLTKPVMIDAFINQLATQQKKKTKSV